jgi:cytidine deaminase
MSSFAGALRIAGSRWREAEPCGCCRQLLAFPCTLVKILACAFSRTGTHTVEEQEAETCPDSNLVRRF